MSDSAEKRRIIFTFDDDFMEFFEQAGIEPDSVTDEEWRSFESMFFAGIAWASVAEIAADTIRFQRNRAK